MEKYPFNRERAILGEPVVTRDGKKAFLKEHDEENGDVSFEIEGVDCGSRWFHSDGRYMGAYTNRDLFMTTPDPIKL